VGSARVTKTALPLQVAAVCYRKNGTGFEFLLVNTNGGKGVLIAVRSKQKADWPPIKDVLGSCEFIVFVDFEKKSVNQRPDCYVLSREDWQDVVKRRLADLRHDYPGIQIDTTNPHEPVFPDQITQRGAEMRGITVKLRYLQPYKEHWGKIINFLAASTALIVPAAAAPTSREGLLRTEGALADDPLWDTIMEKVHRERKTDTRPEVLE